MNFRPDVFRNKRKIVYMKYIVRESVHAPGTSHGGGIPSTLMQPHSCALGTLADLHLDGILFLGDPSQIARSKVLACKFSPQ